MSDLKQIKISELQPNDIFSFDGCKAYIVAEIQSIGANVFQLHYLSTKQWRSFESIKQGSLKVFVAPIGRHYE